STPVTSRSAPTAARDTEFEDQLKRADQAFESGALISPPEANATELYRQAQRRHPDDPRPAAGLEKVIDKLLSAAETQLNAQHLDEAQKLTDQARAIKSDHVRVAFVAAQIGKERERAVLNQARHAASTGNVQEAIAVLDSAKREGERSTLVAEARQELQEKSDQKKLEDRLGEYLGKAADRMQRDQVLEPAEDNARFF